MSVCIFCLGIPMETSTGCTYGMHHEDEATVTKIVKQVKKTNKVLCTKCGLHPKNPVSATNGCIHEYGEEDK